MEYCSTINLNRRVVIALVVRGVLTLLLGTLNDQQTLRFDKSTLVGSRMYEQGFHENHVNKRVYFDSNIFS